MRTAFIDVADVTLHVRTAGAGPAMLLIPQAPVSARTLESRIERLSKDFFCIAPDLPGLGESDALAGGLVTVERMAETMLALLDRFGIERAVAYGQHTGALVATEMGLTAPDRIAGVLIGGYPIYTVEESSHRFTSYAPQLQAPSWDGGHLAWLWWRYREQFIYWPWNTKAPRTRATCAVPSKEFLQAGAGEIAARHDSYAAIYDAAFDYDAEGALRRVSVPVHFILDLADSLSLKIELAAAANPALHRWPGASEEIEAIEHKVALEAARGLRKVVLPAEFPSSARRSVSTWAGGVVGLWTPRGRDAAAPALLVLPPFPAGPRAILPEIGGETGRDIVLPEFLELPQAGQEQAWIEGFAGAIATAIPAAGFDIVAAGGSAALAAALLDAAPDKIGKILLLDPDDRGDGTPFDATLCPSGGHLLRLWDRLRFERMRPPKATPGDPTTVRGRYESLALLGRYGWDAVQRVQAIPAWDRLMAALVLREAALRDSDKVTTVLTGVDRRGNLAAGRANSPRVIEVPGIADAPFAIALSLLGS